MPDPTNSPNGGPMGPASEANEIPPRLGAELTRLAGRPIGPDGFNAASAAGVHFARVHAATLRGRRRLRWASAAAAVVAIGGFVVLQNQTGWSRGGPAIVASSLPGDLNSDGRVDMLDALMLADSVSAGKTQPTWDFNHDAKVDRRDADAIARVAVDLKGGRL